VRREAELLGGVSASTVKIRAPLLVCNSFQNINDGLVNVEFIYVPINRSGFFGRAGVWVTIFFW